MGLKKKPGTVLCGPIDIYGGFERSMETEYFNSGKYRQLSSDNSLMESHNSSLLSFHMPTSPKEIFALIPDYTESYSSLEKDFSSDFLFDDSKNLEKKLSYDRKLQGIASQVQEKRALSTEEKNKQNELLKQNQLQKRNMNSVEKGSAVKSVCMVRCDKQQHENKGNYKEILIGNDHILEKSLVGKNSTDKADNKDFDPSSKSFYRNFEPKSGKCENSFSNKKELEKRQMGGNNEEETTIKEIIEIENGHERQKEKGSLETEFTEKSSTASLSTVMALKGKDDEFIDTENKVSFLEKHFSDGKDNIIAVVMNKENGKLSRKELINAINEAKVRAEKEKLTEKNSSEIENIGGNERLMNDGTEFEDGIEKWELENLSKEVERLEKETQNLDGDENLTSHSNLLRMTESLESLDCHEEMDLRIKPTFQSEEDDLKLNTLELEKIEHLVRAKHQMCVIITTRTAGSCRVMENFEHDETKSTLCFSNGVTFDAQRKVLNYTIWQKIFSDNKWINLSNVTERGSSKTEQTMLIVSYGDNRNRSDSSYNSGSSCGRGNAGGSADGRRFTSGQKGGCGVGGCGGGCGDGGGDGDRNYRKIPECPGEQNRKSDKKLKKKRRLEHGILTNEQITLVFGWLQKQNKSQSVPDALNKILKCLKLCLKQKGAFLDNCTTCDALILMLKHSNGCSDEKCRRCYGIQELFLLVKDTIDGRNIVQPSIVHDEQPRSTFKHILRCFFAISATSEDDEESESDENSSELGENYLSPPSSISTASEKQMEEPPVGQACSKGPSTEAKKDQCMSEYGPPECYLSLGKINYSMPVDAGNVRSGSVIYGSKALLKEMVSSWNMVANQQRSMATIRQADRFSANRVGVILQSQYENMKIQNNNYEQDEEWMMVMGRALGTGVSGSCFACMDSQTQFPFCVKKIALHKFYGDEILIWLDMEHPDIVELYGVVVYDDFVFILEEIITGPTLKEHILKQTLNLYDALTYMQHLLDLLVYLKKKGIIHNDIKADNLLLRKPNESTRLVLIDFGLAMRKSFIPPGTHPVGGQTHWSPEKAASEGYSFPADIWAATAVFVHMLSGTEPWCVRFKHAQLLHGIIKECSPPLQDVPDKLPLDVLELIKSGWTVDPVDRPSANTLRDHEAFKLLDSTSPSIVQHFLSLEPREIEEATEEDILQDILESERLISEVQSLSAQQERSFESLNFSRARLNSENESQTVGKRQQSGVARESTSAMNYDRLSAPLRSHHPMPPLEEEPLLHLEDEAHSEFYQRKMFKEIKRKPWRIEDEEDIDDLTKRYSDLSITGYPASPQQLPSLPFLKSIQKEDINHQSTKEPELVLGPKLHRITLYRDPLNLDGSRLPRQKRQFDLPEECMHSETRVMQTSLPVFVEMINQEVETELGINDLGLRSYDVETETPFISTLMKLSNATLIPEGYHSLGTTVRMLLNRIQVYCIHLHPGRECLWRDVLLTASSEVHRHEVTAFTAEISWDNGQSEAVDISALIPSVPEITLCIMPLNPFQEEGWNWKVEDSRILYNPNYHGPFGPQFD